MIPACHLQTAPLSQNFIWAEKSPSRHKRQMILWKPSLPYVVTAKGGMGLPHSQNSTLSFSVAWDGHLWVALCASGPLDGHSYSPDDIFYSSCIQSGETLLLGLLDGHSPKLPWWHCLWQLHSKSKWWYIVLVIKWTQPLLWWHFLSWLHSKWRNTVSRKIYH